MRNNWDEIRRRPRMPAEDGHALGRMESQAYLTLAERSLETKVRAPLRARGIPV